MKKIQISNSIIIIDRFDTFNISQQALLKEAINYSKENNKDIFTVKILDNSFLDSKTRDTLFYKKIPNLNVIELDKYKFGSFNELSKTGLFDDESNVIFVLSYFRFDNDDCTGLHSLKNIRVIKGVKINNTIVSSPLVISVLKNANFLLASQMLGYKYFNRFKFESGNTATLLSKNFLPSGTYKTKIIFGSEDIKAIVFIQMQSATLYTTDDIKVIGKITRSSNLLLTFLELVDIKKTNQDDSFYLEMYKTWTQT